MKQFIFSTLIFTILLGSTLTAFSQIEYKYDNAGNRYLRRVVTINEKSTQITNDTIQTENTALENVTKETEPFGNGTVTVYPNPTLGVLQVDFTGQMPESEINLFVFDMAGRTVLKQKVQTTNSVVNISEAKPGEYILKITGAGKTLEWGIVKQ